MIVNGALISGHLGTTRSGFSKVCNRAADIKAGYESLHHVSLLVYSLWSCSYDLVIDPDIAALHIYLQETLPGDVLDVARQSSFAELGFDDVTVYWADHTSDDGSGRKPVAAIRDINRTAIPVNPKDLEIIRLHAKIASMQSTLAIDPDELAAVECARIKLLQRRK